MPSRGSSGVSHHTDDDEAKAMGPPAEHILRSLRHSAHNVTAKDVNAAMNDEMQMRAPFKKRMDARLSEMME